MLHLFMTLTALLDRRARRDQAGISMIVEMLLVALLLVVVIGAATPVVRDNVLDMINNIFDQIGNMG